MHVPTLPLVASLPGTDAGGSTDIDTNTNTNTDTDTDRGNEQTATNTPHLLRSHLALLAVLLLFISGSVTWLLWPDVVAALSVAPPPSLVSSQKHAASLQSLTPPLLPTLAPSPTASPWITLAQDSFQRPDQSLWGDASSGIAWGADANMQAAFAIVSGTGRIANAQGKRLYAAIIGPQGVNAEIDCTFAVQDADHANVGVALHWQNASNWVRATLNGSALMISQMAHDHLSRLGESPFALQDGATVTLRFRADQGTLAASAWIAGSATATPAPTTWMLMLHEPSISVGTGSGGIIAVLRGQNVVAVTSFLETGEQGG